MSNLVNGLGLIAGAVWIMAAIWFEFIRPGRIHAKYIAGTFLIGSALILGSSSAVTSSPTLAETAAVIANLLFLLLGVGAWVYIECVAKDTPTADDLDRGVQT